MAVEARTKEAAAEVEERAEAEEAEVVDGAPLAVEHLAVGATGTALAAAWQLSVHSRLNSALVHAAEPVARQLLLPDILQSGAASREPLPSPIWWYRLALVS